VGIDGLVEDDKLPSVILGAVRLGDPLRYLERGWGTTVQVRIILAAALDVVVRGRPDDEQFDILSPRELQVLKLIAEAHTSKEIAKELFISIKTVERHRANILDKLGMTDRVELTRYAIRRGLIQA